MRPLLAGLPAALLVLALDAAPALAQHIEYERPVETAPTEETIGEGYATPQVQRPRPRSAARQRADVALLAASLGAAAWLALRRRQRGALVGLSVLCLAYFGFYREGCICPIGATQNVATALVDPRAAVPHYVIAIFVLPLAAALLFGRVFCSGVCPLGAIQERVGNTRPVHSSTTLLGRLIPGAHRSRRALDWLAGPSREKACGLDPVRDAGSDAPWLVPRFRSPLRGLGHPALSVVLVTERLAAQHAALPVRGTPPR